MKKIIAFILTFAVCVSFASCTANISNNDAENTSNKVSNEIKTSEDYKAGPLIFDGKEYYHTEFDWTKKTLTVFSGKNDFVAKHKFDFSDTTFYWNALCYGNEIYYVLSDVDTKMTDVYTIADDKLKKQFSIENLGEQWEDCEIIDGYLYYATPTEIYRIGLDGNNKKCIVSFDASKDKHILFKYYDGLIYAVDDATIFSMSLMGENKKEIFGKSISVALDGNTEEMAHDNIDNFYIESNKIVFSSEYGIYAYDIDSKTAVFFSVNKFANFGVYKGKIFYAAYGDNDDVTFTLHSCSFDGANDTEIYKSSAGSWFSGISFYESRLYCTYSTDASGVDKAIVLMNLDGSNSVKLNKSN